MEIYFNEVNNRVLAKLVWQEYSSIGHYLLNQAANKLSLQTGFDRLLALEALPEIVLYPHQQATVLKVLRELRGRAVLADEVGLGKTIEAGIIMKEYLLRSLVKRILLLVPASLVTQWYEELVNRLKIPFKVQDGSVSWQEDLLLVSIDYAKREPQRSKLLQNRYDLVVVDEAHKLKNKSTVNWQFVNGLQKTFLLLLTATPVQNDLRELYNLITLLKPGQLKTFREFKQEFVLDKRTPKNVEKLKNLLGQVMVRSNRRETLLKLPKRVVSTQVVQPTVGEREFMAAAVSGLRAVYRQRNQKRQTILPLIVMAREVCSSPQAAVASLEQLFVRERDLPAAERAAIQRAISIGSELNDFAKLTQLLKIARKMGTKILVFTEFRRTQDYLAQRLEAEGFNTTIFHGGLSLAEKDAAVANFRQRSQIMISTESGGEGRNLQFCHVLVNYDLPWNPMRVEQRIGRLHRLGQQHDVQIINLIAANTIEEYVLQLLDEKLRLFSDVVGDVEAIIAAGGLSLEKQIADRFFGVADSGAKEGDDIVDQIVRRISEYRELQSFTDGLLGVGS